MRQRDPCCFRTTPRVRNRRQPLLTTDQTARRNGPALSIQPASRRVSRSCRLAEMQTSPETKASAPDRVPAATLSPTDRTDNPDARKPRVQSVACWRETLKTIDRLKDSRVAPMD